MTTVYRLVGKGTTSNGVATMTQKTDNEGETWSSCDGYVGTGKGNLNFIASTDSTITSTSLISNEYEVLDAIYYDSASTDTKERYFINDDYDTGIGYNSSDKAIEITCGTNKGYNWCDIRTNYPSYQTAPIKLNSLTGKTVKFKATVTGLDGKRMALRIIDGQSQRVLVDSGWFTNDGEHETPSYSFASDRTASVIFRVTPHTSLDDWNSGTSYEIKDFKVYVV